MIHSVIRFLALRVAHANYSVRLIVYETANKTKDKMVV